MRVTVGVFGMSVTPFDAGGRIDEGVLRAHVRSMAAAGLGVYLCSQGSGEGDLLAFDEKVEVYRIGADELRGHAPVFAAGIGLGDSTSRLRDLATAAEAAGVDGVQILGPRPGPRVPDARELERYFRTMVEAVQCDVHLSHNPVLTGYGLPFGLVEQIVNDYAHVRVLNVSEPAFGPLIARVARLVDHFGARLEVRIGILAAISAAHALGARGLLCSEANVAPGLAASVWAALEAGDSGAWSHRFATLNRLSSVLAPGGPPALKEAMRMCGRDGGCVREPYLPLDAEARGRLAAALRPLDLDTTTT